MPEMLLERLGWNEKRKEDFERIRASLNRGHELEPARVTSVARNIVDIAVEAGPRKARLTGKLLAAAKEAGMPLAVGDWVACEALSDGSCASIRALLPRRGSIERKRAISGGRRIVDGEIAGGRTEAQAVAANVDVAYIVIPLDADSAPGEGFSRIERSMAISAAGGVKPVLIYNKCDLVDGDALPGILEAARAICADSHALSAMTGEGIGSIEETLGQGRSAVFFGPSGAGKSSIVNALMRDGGKGEYPEGFQGLDTGPLSQATGKGLHTTTSRELFVLPRGGIVIDTPGMRELALWADEGALSDTFADIEEFAAGCRFSDCSHGVEPGCRVREALETGELDERRFGNWRRMRGEVARLDMRKIALWVKQNAKSKRYFDEDHR
jgi:ribosome biogenesis GTPase / thiamine phosphate phosphatase